MLEVRDGIFADAEIPVGMAGPLHVEIVAKIERQLDAFAFQFIDDGAVINSLDWNAFAGLIVIKFSALFANLSDADGSDAEHLFRKQEIGTGLLFLGMHFHQNDVGWIVAGDNRIPQKAVVRGRVEAAEEITELRIQAEYINVSMRKDGLIGVEGREGL